MGWSQPCIVWLLARIYWELLPRSDFRTCDRSSLQLLRYTSEWAISIALINVSSWMTLYLCQDSWFIDVASAWYPKQPFLIGCFTCMNQIFAEKWLFRVRKNSHLHLVRTWIVGLSRYWPHARGFEDAWCPQGEGCGGHQIESLDVTELLLKSLGASLLLQYLRGIHTLLL